MSLAAGRSQQLTATGSYSGGATAPLTSGVGWSSSDAGIATVDATGVVTGVMAGAAIITSTHSDTGLTGTASVTVTPPVLDSLVVVPTYYSPPTIVVGQSLSLFAAYHYSDGTRTKLADATWATSDASVLGVDATGLASALSIGGATITATDPATGMTGAAEFTVVNEAALPLTSLPFAASNLGDGYLYYQVSGLDPTQFYTVTLSGLTMKAASSDLVMNAYQDAWFGTPFCCAQTPFAPGVTNSCTGRSSTGTLLVAIWAAADVASSPITLDVTASTPIVFARPGPQSGALLSNASTHLLYQVTGLTPGGTYLFTLSGITDNVTLNVLSDDASRSSLCTAAYAGNPALGCSATVHGADVLVDVDGSRTLAPMSFTITVSP